MFDPRNAEAYLRALDEQLGLRKHRIELVVCGGTASEPFRSELIKILEWLDYGDVVRGIP